MKKFLIITSILLLIVTGMFSNIIWNYAHGHTYGRIYFTDLMFDHFDRGDSIINFTYHINDTNIGNIKILSIHKKDSTRK